MDFRIADTFTDSLGHLTGDEQKAVKMTAFDLQMNPSNPGMQFHRIDGAKDKDFWSVRVSRDIRIIVHRTESSLLLCYVGHHDDAYRWAERRKLEAHPTTGAAQLVEIRETVKEIIVPVYVERETVAPAKPSLFASKSDDELLSYGVPPEWLGDVKQADEDGLLAVADHLPAEAAEALLELAVGGKPLVPQKTVAVELTSDIFFSRAPVNPFDHPDAQRRFRVMANADELAQALDFPWDTWTIFLHPAQRQIVEGNFAGPARVAGSAGTGKTVVALHRAVYLARKYTDARVLLTTFSETLANSLRTMLRRLVSSEPQLAERIEIYSLDAIAERLYTIHFGKPKIPGPDDMRRLLAGAAKAVPDHGFSQRFLLAEWEEVVDAWQLQTWEEYRDVQRLGRKTRLPESRRAVLWAIFEATREACAAEGFITRAELYSRLAEKLTHLQRSPFDYAVVDEAQDVSVPQLRFLAALGDDRPNALFFAGDLGQRIFQQPFSWLSLGVDIRGRSRTLRVNYRTSHQIRSQADRLLGPELADVDGNVEERRGTVSVFNGPPPDVRVCESADEESQVVSDWLAERIGDGVQPDEVGIFVRSPAELERAQEAIKRAGLPFKTLDERMTGAAGHVSISTMHLAKGLEFRAVAVMACDDEIVPLQARIEQVADEADLEEVYNTERHLLYVACTRARDNLLVTGVDPASEFLDDLRRDDPTLL